MSTPIHDTPCAAHGLTSYRFTVTESNGYTWHVMIGAKGDSEAMGEACRATSKGGTLFKWDASRETYRALYRAV